MKRYGFFGGSFNPVTNAHIGCALQIKEQYNLDKVIFVPMGNQYRKDGLLQEQHRYEMLLKATNPYDELEISKLELGLDTNLSMLEAFKLISSRYIDTSNYFVLGADNLLKLAISEEVEKLAKNYSYIIINRKGIQIQKCFKENPILEKNKDHFHILEENHYQDINSTIIRECIKNNQLEEIRQWVPEEVYEYIQENKLYR